MFVPVFGDWVQPIASFATRGAAPGIVLSQLVISAVLQLHKNNVSVLAVISDGAGNNRSMWNQLPGWKIQQKKSLGPTKNPVVPTDDALGPTEASLGPTEASLGATEASLGPTEASLGPTEGAACWRQVALGPTEDAVRPTGVAVGPRESSAATRSDWTLCRSKCGFSQAT